MLWDLHFWTLIQLSDVSLDLFQVLIGSYGAFWLFAAILVVSMFFIIFVVPETQGKTLEEIEMFYTGKIPVMDAEMTPALQRASGSSHRVSSLANLKLTPSQIF